MTSTTFTRLVGAVVPIQVASMPGVSTVELVSAVARAGAVAMIGGPFMSPKSLEALLERLPRDTPGAIGVNFLAPFVDPECIPVAARHTRIVEFFYGEPNPEWIARAHALGALVSWQVGSLAEALAAERAGCDFVIAQGTQAGGHVRGTTSLLPLLSQVLDAVRVPVLAAGGIATARDLAAVLACGAGGARMGTRFLASAESGAHPAYVESLLAASAADTCLTEAFSGGWPDAPHRVLRSSIEAAEELPAGVIGEAQLGDRRIPVERFSVVPPTIGATGHVEAMALYAGESVTNVTSVRPAAELVSELIAGAERLLAKARGGPITGPLTHIDISMGYPEKSIPFYAAFFEALGYRRWTVPMPEWQGANPTRATWGTRYSNGARFDVEVRPARPESRDRKYDRYEPGPHHLAFHAESREVVERVHRALVAIGAAVLDPPTDYGGQPGYDKGYFAVFFADPDGVKLEVAHIPRANP